MKNHQTEKKVDAKTRIMRPGQGWRPRTMILFAFLVTLLLSLLPALAQENPPAENQEESQTQTRPHFYDVDREVTIEGQIEDLRFENRYEGKGNFLVLLVKEKGSGELMEVETAPAWFFRTDIHKGERIRLTGSLTEERKDGRKLVMARELKLGNQTITLRDRRGFPTWSRGQGRRRGTAW